MSLDLVCKNFFKKQQVAIWGQEAAKQHGMFEHLECIFQPIVYARNAFISMDNLVYFFGSPVSHPHINHWLNMWEPRLKPHIQRV